MDQSILISIVLPLYNGAEHICETLAAIQAQTFTAAELIVVDDGCSDNSPQMVVDFCKNSDSAILQRLTLLKQANAGVAAARNFAIKHSKAPWLALLDQDDLWQPALLEKFAAGITMQADKEWFYTAFKRFYASGKEVLKKHGSQDQDQTLKLLLNGTLFIPPSAALIRKDTCLAVKGFNSEFTPSDDWDFFIKLASNYKVGYIDECLVYFRSHPSSTAKQQKIKIFNGQQKVLELHQELFITKFGPKPFNKRMANILWHIGREYYLAHDAKNAKKYLWRALKLNPSRTKLIVAWLKAIFKIF